MAESLPTEWFINDHAIIDQAIAVLNEAVVADQSAITELMLMEVEVNERLVEHPTIQVGKDQLGYPPILPATGSNQWAVRRGQRQPWLHHGAH